MWKLLRKIDFFILLPALLLSSIGLLMIFSISFESDSSYLLRQAIYIFISLLLYFIIIKIGFKHISDLSYLFYLSVLVLLILTFILGVEARGSVRWLDLGFVTLQGSELAKPVLVLALANYLGNNKRDLRKFLGSGILVGAFVFLIVLQPDLSTSAILFFTWLFMVFAAGVYLLYLILFTLFLLLLIPIFWEFLLKDYQRSRILTFFNPDIDPLGSSYNVVQALIAFGSGQIFGRGLGRGTQSHLDFLPEGRTDFIFAATGEELGFVGIVLVIIVFSFLVFWLLKRARESEEKNKSLFLLGSAFVLMIQFFINAGMNMGIFPVSGVTLPFVSFGGSSMIALFILLALCNAAVKKHV